jgi:hypothetical protein
MDRNLERGQLQKDNREREQDLPERSIEDQLNRGLQRQPRRQHLDRSRKYYLNEQQTASLESLGAFRAIRPSDLEDTIYRGNKAAFQLDVRNLADQGLVRNVTLKGRTPQTYLTLTKLGKDVADRQLKHSPGQQFYAGVKKLRELKHDSKLYRLYQKETGHIRSQGGTPKRVVLDYELKKVVNRELAAIRKLSRQEQAARRQEIADRYDLSIVNGKIQFPDLRIEYEDRNHTPNRVDVELVTDHYRGRQIAAKRAAGFKLYGDGYRGKRAERSHDILPL